MPDFPGVLMNPQPISVATFSQTSDAGEASVFFGQAAGNAVWPAANRAIYVPVKVEMPMTVYTMGVIVGAQSGNLDVGVYDEKGNRLVSSGSTAVGSVGFQSINIADTALNVGVYFLAMCVSNTTASFTRWGTAAVALQTVGVQQQAVGVVTLPDPATFANPASSYLPLICAYGVATN